MGRTSNPMLTEEAFKKAAAARGGAGAQQASGEGVSTPRSRTSEDKMSLQGTVNKCFILVAIVLIAGYFPWTTFSPENAAAVQGYVMIGLIGGLITALVTVFKQNIAHITAPLYAMFEGFLLGGVSAIFEAQYPGIVIQAAFLTVAVLVALLLAYSSGLIKATENFKLGIFAATGGIAILYLVNLVMGFFGGGMNFIHAATPMGIGFSVVVVIIAALNLVLDFDFIETGVEMGAPKHMEWYAAFGLLVTLVWLYLEILRLLAKLRER
ncbi:Bax inhibitor-1/YccA family protein [Geovibrio sp. L21-Ace-BES]|uniref:Bax inhibitor-1/YccA family protein n=1 Tax=Limisalsivibrio acetivorans TaxID=1304888 RepID=UPI0009DC1C08